MRKRKLLRGKTLPLSLQVGGPMAQASHGKSLAEFDAMRKTAGIDSRQVPCRGALSAFNLQAQPGLFRTWYRTHACCPDPYFVVPLVPLPAGMPGQQAGAQAQ